jgi:Na+-driven multidrug efflux pump
MSERSSQSHSEYLDPTSVAEATEGPRDSIIATEPGPPIERRESAEDIALGSGTPLKTLVILSIGPFISQLTQALFGFIDSIWVEKGTGVEGLSAFSTFSNFDTIGRAFGFFLSVAASSKISALFGAGKADEAPQVVADLLRVGIILAIVVPAALIPCLKPAALWFGAKEELADDGFEYISYVVYFAFIPIIYVFLCGCVLAEGRTYTFAMLQLATLILDTVIFDPIFLLTLKLGMFGKALATILAEGLPMLAIAFLYFSGCFGVKPRAADLLKKFSPHTSSALKVGLSQLLQQLSLTVPALFLRKYLGMMCDSDEMYVDVTAAFNTQSRYYQILFILSAAVTMGFVPCAAYAFAAERVCRVRDLLIHCTWIGIAWAGLNMIVTMGFARQISLAFSSKESYLKYAEPQVRNSNALAVLSPISLIIQALLQALQLGGRASLVTLVTRLSPIPVFSTVLYFTGKHDPGRLLYAYAIQHAISLLVALPMGLTPLLDVLKRAKLEATHDKVYEAAGGEVENNDPSLYSRA